MDQSNEIDDYIEVLTEARKNLRSSLNDNENDLEENSLPPS